MKQTQIFSPQGDDISKRQYYNLADGIRLTFDKPLDHPDKRCIKIEHMGPNLE